MLAKYVEDVKQDEKSVPDLVESIMKAPGLVKEALRRSLLKMNQFRILDPKSTKIWIARFALLKIMDSRQRRPTQPARPSKFD